MTLLNVLKNLALTLFMIQYMRWQETKLVTEKHFRRLIKEILWLIQIEYEVMQTGGNDLRSVFFVWEAKIDGFHAYKTKDNMLTNHISQIRYKIHKIGGLTFLPTLLQ